MTQHAGLKGRACGDPRSGREVIKLNPGDHIVSSQPKVLLLTVLGSCVAACIRDPVAGVGGMNHFMLPDSPDGRWGKISFSPRYGNFAMEILINGILRHGGRRERLETKVFGGARVGRETSEIGDRNAQYVEYYLKTEGLVPIVTKLRGDRARRIAYMPVSGRAFMVELPPQAPRIEAIERATRYAPPTGTVELFL